MRRIHLIGIGGTGLSAIARLLHARGWQVSGCDRQASPTLDALRAQGMNVHIGHDPAHLRSGVDLVLRTSALPADHPEVQAARAAGIPVLTRREFLPTLTQGYRTLAVAGTHGKTTTTAMLAWALAAAGQDPTALIGGEVPPWGNVRLGQSPWFVIEADEYDHMFWGLTPEVAVLTTLELDHPDLFPTWDAYARAFAGFVDRVQRALVVAAFDPGVQRLLHDHPPRQPVLTFGWDDRADYWADEVQWTGVGYRFVLRHRRQALAQVQLTVPGRHNVANALAALAVVHHLGLDVNAAARGLATFPGAGRRFTVVADQDGIAWVNDYAHHPTEIRATLAAARERYPDRALWAVWQPHTYTRVRALWDAFIRAFEAADHVIVSEIYAAREAPLAGVSGQAIARAIQHPRVHYAADLESVANALRAIQPPAAVVLLSAGDLPQVLTRLGLS
ncbi:MAG: UDP-N-acetylmuramate--L-alanine ligase [Chloroflexi bacterium]|nr:UDP-N-acetylmuramate--L-alanine ligase [Chloroflexota bacterium]